MCSYGQKLSGKIGEGTGYVTVSDHLQELLPGTTYHYRIVTSNEVGTVEGADHTFTTQAAGSEPTLPDGRAWELVSPPDKDGALIEPFEAGGEIQAASDGTGITYLTIGPAVGENAKGKIIYSQILSTRGPDGWASEDLALPHHALEAGESGGTLFSAGLEEYKLFSSDLSLAAVNPFVRGTPPLASEVTERTVYLRDDANGSFVPLVSGANVPPGTKYGGIEEAQDENSELRVIAGTPDLSHVILTSPYALTKEAIPDEVLLSNGLSGQRVNFYEWSGGTLQLVNVLPNGKPTEGRYVTLAGAPGVATNNGLNVHALSGDGHRVAWQVELAVNTFDLYVRDMVEKRTVKVGGSRAQFQAMSSNGSSIFFLEYGELYVFNFETGATTDLTADRIAGEGSAGAREAVLGTSEDGSYVYFVATGALASGAVDGEDNLYVSHDQNGAWSTTYIATLSSEDEPDWFADQFRRVVNLAGVTSRVSPNGRYLEFMSNRSLTGYDNIDVNSGQADEEVYLYDAVAGRLVCVSCNPSGQRPTGVFDRGGSSLLVDRSRAWGVAEGPGGHWLAGSVPAWENVEGTVAYQPRFLSDSGRIFFDSPDALVPQDTNGLEDVYEYEPAGVGSCESTDAAFSEHANGCVSLISSGTSSEESAFYDASESGDDVFFLTASRLSAARYDTSLDVYDAHVCSTAAPCAAAAVLPPPCNSGGIVQGVALAAA